MYMELHDLLLLLSIMKGNYNISRSKIPNFKLTETRQSNEFEIPKHRLRKCDENFWTRATRLYNIVRKTIDKPLSVVITVILDRFEKVLHFPVDAMFHYSIAIQSDWINETETGIT